MSRVFLAMLCLALVGVASGSTIGSSRNLLQTGRKACCDVCKSSCKFGVCDCTTGQGSVLNTCIKLQVASANCGKFKLVEATVGNCCCSCLQDAGNNVTPLPLPGGLVG